MSTIKANAITGSTTNSDLTLSGNGTGGVKVNDYFVQTKGSDIASATSLTLGKDGNQFDVTGTTTITSIATQGIGSYVTLHFDGALTFTHHSTDLVLPGAANITTAAGDIAVMYEYASGDWRCVSYTKASGAAVVAAGGVEFISTTTMSGETTEEFGEANIETGYIYIIDWFNIKSSTDNNINFQLGTGAGPTYQSSNYEGTKVNVITTTLIGAASPTSMMAATKEKGGASANEFSSGTAEFRNLAETTYSSFFASCVYHNDAGVVGIAQAASMWQDTTAVTGIKLIADTYGSPTYDTGVVTLSRRKVKA